MMPGDKELVLKTSSVPVSGEYVARELLEKLVESVDFKSRGHPMYGTILDAEVSNASVILTVGQESAQKAEGEATKVESTVGFLQDFVKSLIRNGYSEFKGAGKVTGETDKVTVSCRPAKLTAARVAQEAAEMIAKGMLTNPDSAFHNLLLSPVATRRSVKVKVCAGERKWEQFASEAKKLFEQRADEGNLAAKAVGPAEIKTSKGVENSVVVSFEQVVEPPLIDVGGGHRVACYLFKPPAE
jgi:hypothetical protein